MIQGGGYVALEFATLFSGLGSHVVVAHRGDEILRGFDDDVRRHLRVEMEARDVRFVLNHQVSEITQKGHEYCATLTDGAKHDVDQVMFATGRRPNTAGIGLEAAGVKLDPVGAVVVDANSRSNVPSIYAIGDVTNRLALTPVAIREGHAVADSLFGDKPWAVDHDGVPTAVFSEPEVGVVGLSEGAAREKGLDIQIFHTAFRPLKATLSERATSVLMKMVVERKSDRVLGIHIVGEAAAEMIQMAAVAVKMGARKADFDDTVALHPTSSEELVTLKASK